MKKTIFTVAWACLYAAISLAQTQPNAALQTFLRESGFVYYEEPHGDLLTNSSVTMPVWSGFASYERLVEFPLWEEYAEWLKSDIADMRSLGPAEAGMITAGKFLEHFVAYPWLHFDIAGPAFNHTAEGYKPKGGTGVGVRLMWHFLKYYGNK